MVDPNRWPSNTLDFERKWSQYKQRLGLFDFSDLVDRCLRDVAVAPHNPSVILADEAQDLNAMQLQLIRRWGKHTQYSVLAGDDDQTIYWFTGASADAILASDIPGDHKIILNQSYRLPQSIHKLANQLIHQVTTRQEKIYLPRPGSGSVHRLTSGTYKSPEYFILSTAMKHLEQGKTIMFLASCSYMLKPLLRVLSKNAIPFHNPYRKANGFWNPLRSGSRRSAAGRILLLVGHPQTGKGHHHWRREDVALWADWLCENGTLRPGAKARLQSSETEMEVTVEQLQQLFEPGAFHSFQIAYESGPRALLQWWRSRVTVEVHSRIQPPADLVAYRGVRALTDVPRVIVGTIHSVKGGQADIVYLFPDLSQAGDAQYQKFGPSRDSMIRVFYVGVTRAREALYICQHDSGLAIKI
jgi:DNA helicase II / ATP-dependent DNA helicase PcrA